LKYHKIKRNGIDYPKICKIEKYEGKENKQTINHQSVLPAKHSGIYTGVTLKKQFNDWFR
jgi:hypothetical protein